MDKEKAVILGIAQTRFREEYKRTRRTRKVLPAVGWALLAATLVMIVIIMGFSFSICRNDAMGDRIKNGQIVVTDRFSYLIRHPERGDIVSFWLGYGNGIEQIVQRRIVGLPGDEIEIRGGYIYINGQRCLEEYITGTTTSEVTKVTVPDNTYYVLCDDREQGPDSRDEMYVLPDSIIGSVVYTIAVPEKFTNSAAAKAFEFINDLL